jgi:superfamily II DNA or RNA helicase
VGFYVGGMKQDDLVKSESKHIILGTYNMAAEGLDIKQLNTIVFATPMTNVVQAVGRILRKVHPDIVPEIYDIVDNFSSFINQSIKRRRFYCKENYPVYCPLIHSCEAACTAIDSLSALRIQKYSKRKKKKSIPKCLFLHE